MKPVPRPYQIAGRDFLAGRRVALLADEMRVGKTPQAILAADAVGARRVLVACPAIACEHWRREWSRWSATPATPLVCGPKTDPSAADGVVIASYARLHALLPALAARTWDALILDECHLLKTPTARRTQAVFGRNGLSHRARRIWALSGTPATLHVGDLWVLLRVFGATTDSYGAFVERYCTMNALGRPCGTKRGAEAAVRKLLDPFMLRRTRADVAPELPRIAFEFLEVEGAAPVDLPIPPGLADDALVEYLDAHADALRETRSAVALAKVPPLVEHVRFALENELIGQTVVFGYHVEPLEAARDALRAAGHETGLITGATRLTERAALADAFRAGRLKVLVANIVAAGTAIDLSAASHGYFLEQSWVPGDNLQAANRLVSVAAARPVSFDILTWPGSFDDRVLRVLRRRLVSLDTLLGA